MEHLGYNKEAYARADKNLTAILNPIPAWKKTYDLRQKQILQRLRGDW